jgi:hypothetical protein
MKNVKISQIKVKEDSLEIEKNRKFEVYSPQITTSKGRFSYSNNNPLVELFAPQTTTNKNYSSNDKAYSLSHIKKNEYSSKSKQGGLNNPTSKSNVSVSNVNSTV